EDYLNYAGTTIDAIKEERREDAIKTLKTRLVLEAIIKKEEIKVEKEELDAEVKAGAEAQNKEVEDYRKTLNEYDFGRMMNKLVADKLFAFLREKNTIA
ncbi:MAG: trigger factor, partial [Clostridia bacterium]